MVRAFVATLSELAYIGVLARYGGRRGVAGVPDAPDPWESAYARAGVEPPLDEVLRDPIVQLLMQADRLDRSDLRPGSAAGRG